MNEILSQREIDELIIAINNGQLDEWKSTHENRKQQNERFRFSTSKIYTIEDYDLFYCNYALETLTRNMNILRRYAYGDNQSFKSFSHFIVLEDYKTKGINAVTVVGIPEKDLKDFGEQNSYNIEHGSAYLVDASSLEPVD